MGHEVIVFAADLLITKNNQVSLLEWEGGLSHAGYNGWWGLKKQNLKARIILALMKQYNHVYIINMHEEGTPGFVENSYGGILDHFSRDYYFKNPQEFIAAHRAAKIQSNAVICADYASSTVHDLDLNLKIILKQAKIDLPVVNAHGLFCLTSDKIFFNQFWSGQIQLVPQSLLVNLNRDYVDIIAQINQWPQSHIITKFPNASHARGSAILPKALAGQVLNMMKFPAEKFNTEINKIDLPQAEKNKLTQLYQMLKTICAQTFLIQPCLNSKLIDSQDGKRAGAVRAVGMLIYDGDKIHLQWIEMYWQLAAQIFDPSQYTGNNLFNDNSHTRPDENMQLPPQVKFSADTQFPKATYVSNYDKMLINSALEQHLISDKAKRLFVMDAGDFIADFYLKNPIAQDYIHTPGMDTIAVKQLTDHFNRFLFKSKNPPKNSEIFILQYFYQACLNWQLSALPLQNQDINLFLTFNVGVIDSNDYTLKGTFFYANAILRILSNERFKNAHTSAINHLQNRIKQILIKVAPQASKLFAHKVGDSSGTSSQTNTPTPILANASFNNRALEKIQFFIEKVQMNLLTSNDVVDRTRYPYYHSHPSVPSALVKFKNELIQLRTCSSELLQELPLSAELRTQFHDPNNAESFGHFFIGALAVASLGIGECAESAIKLTEKLILAGYKNLFIVVISLTDSKPGMEKTHDFVVAHPNLVGINQRMPVDEFFKTLPTDAIIADAFLGVTFTPGNPHPLFQAYLKAYGGTANLLLCHHLFNFTPKSLESLHFIAHILAGAIKNKHPHLLPKYADYDTQNVHLIDPGYIPELLKVLNITTPLLFRGYLNKKSYQLDAVAIVDDDLDKNAARKINKALDGQGEFVKLSHSEKNAFILPGINIPEKELMGKIYKEFAMKK